MRGGWASPATPSTNGFATNTESTCACPDHRRIAVQITIADDQHSVNRLVDGLRDQVQHADGLPAARPIDLPSLSDFELDQAVLRRDAFFGTAEHIPAHHAPGRIAAETISPYRPGVPVVLPGEVITKSVDPQLQTIRVVAHS